MAKAWKHGDPPLPTGVGVSNDPEMTLVDQVTKLGLKVGDLVWIKHRGSKDKTLMRVTVWSPETSEFSATVANLDDAIASEAAKELLV